MTCIKGLKFKNHKKYVLYICCVTTSSLLQRSNLGEISIFYLPQKLTQPQKVKTCSNLTHFTSRKTTH